VLFRSRNLAKGLTAVSDEQLERPGIFTGDAPWEQRAGFLVRSGQAPGTTDRDPITVHEIHAELQPIWERATAMDGPNAPLTRSVAGRRDFDLNVDGVAHYGMLPDFLQDLRNLGLTEDDLAPLFRSAEDYIELWERCLSRPAPGDGALPFVKVDATDLSRLFWASDSVVVEDTTAPLVLEEAAGEGFLQSRTYPPGTTPQARGLVVCEYRVALEGVAGKGRIQSLAIDAGAFEPVEYRPGEEAEAYVVTSGGIGSVALGAVSRAGRMVTFSFDDGGVGAGSSSCFFGFCTRGEVGAGVASLVDGAGRTYEVPARVPARHP
jgi:hypothetical protein